MSKKRTRNEEEEDDELLDTSSSSSSIYEDDVPLNPLGVLEAEEEDEEEEDQGEQPANYKRIKLDALGSIAVSMQQMASTLERTLQQVEKISKNSESLLFMRK